MFNTCIKDVLHVNKLNICLTCVDIFSVKTVIRCKLLPYIFILIQKEILLEDAMYTEQ